VAGAENVPASGPVILAATHESMMDVPVLVVASPRPVIFMAISGLFARRVGSWFFRVLGAFPVDRDRADVGAAQAALATLERGNALGVFPEGTRNFGLALGPFQEGAAWLALRAGVPIVPCAIVGTSPRGRRGQWWKWLRRRRVTVTFGAQIRVEREGSAARRRVAGAELTRALRARIESLLVG